MGRERKKDRGNERKRGIKTQEKRENEKVAMM